MVILNFIKVNCQDQPPQRGMGVLLFLTGEWYNSKATGRCSSILSTKCQILIRINMFPTMWELGRGGG